MPISMGIRPMPSSSSRLPKVKRGVAAMGSRPIMPMPMPSSTATRPFHSERPESALSVTSEKAVSSMYSGGPKCSAMAASAPAARIRQMSLKASPNTEE